MSLVRSKQNIGSNSSDRRLSTRGSLLSKKSQSSGSFGSAHGSKFGRSVSKFPRRNDPSLVQSVSIVNSRVISTLINFPVKTNSKLPDLTRTEATDCIRELGSFFNILDYEFNYASFWILDILSKIIKHMQLKGFSVFSQNISLAWFRYVLRCISISGDTREDIFSLLGEMFLKAEESVKAGNSIPQPEEMEILDKKSNILASGSSGSLLSSKSVLSISSRQSRKKLSQKLSKSSRKSSLISHASNRSRSSKSSKSNVKTSGSADKVAVNLQTLYTIIEMIYEVFGDRFMFSLISEAYSSPTIVTPVEIPLDFKDPKQLRPALVVTPPESPRPKKASAAKSGKKGKDKGKGKRKGSPSPIDAAEVVDEDKKSSKKGKNKEKDLTVKKGGKEGKGKKKSKPSLSIHQEEETNNETKAKGKDKGRKTKKKSKPSMDTEITQANNDIKDINTKTQEIIKSSSLEEIKDEKILSVEDKLKLFDRTVAPEMKLEMKKIEVKDKFILPLSEGVRKGYVENLIKSLLPPETKPINNANVLQEKTERKSRKSSSLKGKKNTSLKGGKKAKGKKK